MRMIILAGSLLLTLGAPAMAETIYRWVDSQGVTHFSAQPPQGRQADSPVSYTHLTLPTNREV